MVADGRPGRLFIVSTPIGNLGDFSFRAVETLQSVALVLAEDTRHSRPLLDRHGVATPMQSYHEHNEAKSTPAIVARLISGDDIALISDAGTPLLSDPGGRLVAAAAAAGVTIVPIPGASALLAALVGCGLPTDRFRFYGFPARKGRERRELFAEIAASPDTSVLYEAPGRVGDTLADLVAAGMGEQQAVVARELTKQFEEFRRGTVAALAAYYADTPARGEVVLLVAGRPNAPLDEQALRALTVTLRETGLLPSAVAAQLVQETGCPRNLAYRLAHEP